MHPLSRFLGQVQAELFPRLEESWGPLTDSERRLVKILELVQVERVVRAPTRGGKGRPQKDLRPMARAFLAMRCLQIPSHHALIETLRSSPNLLRICGWERPGEVPSESSFSRAFAEFSESGVLLQRHEELIKENYEDRLVCHISRDATAIDVRQRVKRRPKKKRRRRDNHRIRRQTTQMTLSEMIAELPKEADHGCKRNSRGNLSFWPGFKLHVDWDDAMTPISCILTSASLNDSQAAVPLSQMSLDRVTSLYDLMDSAYDSKLLKSYCESIGHVPIIDMNLRGRPSKREPLSPAQLNRLKMRTVAERGFALLKDSFGARIIYVRGHAKVLTHLMFGILALTAESLMRYVT